MNMKKITLIIIRSENSLFKKTATLRIVALAEVGKKKTLKNQMQINLQGYMYPVSSQCLQLGQMLLIDWFVFCFVGLNIFSSRFKESNLASFNGGKAPDIFFNLCQSLPWVNMVGDQGEIEEILWGEKTKLCQVSKMNYFSSSVVTLVSVSMPLSNTLLWILKACLQRKSRKP